MVNERGGDDVDLSKVMPLRRETVRRRIAALEEYEGLPHRTLQERMRLCESIGLTPPSFYRLWRSWRTLRDPVALQGTTVARGLRNPNGDRDYVEHLLESLAAGGSTEAKVLEIERRARKEGVTIRSRSSLRRLVREIQNEGATLPLAGSHEGMIAVDMVPIEMAVEVDGRMTLPLAAIVLHPRSGAVLSVMLSVGTPSPAGVAAALARWLEVVPSDGPGTTVDVALIPSAHDPEWAELSNVLRRNGVKRIGPEGRRMPAGSVIAEALGRRLLGIDVRPRMAHRPSEQRRPLPRSTRIGHPLHLAEAQAAIDERVDSAIRPALVLPSAVSLAADLRTAFGP